LSGYSAARLPEALTARDFGFHAKSWIVTSENTPTRHLGE
jgi:hypothetical protein